MTTRQRIDLLSRAYPRLFPKKELLRMVRAQLGHVEALDRWVPRDGIRVRARAPRLAYHICAGNLAISAITSIAHGLILGSGNIVKLPRRHEGRTAAKEIADFIVGLPAPLRKLVTPQTALDEFTLAMSDAIVAFGSDETIHAIRSQVRAGQRLAAHGHAVSFLWLAQPDQLTAREARACAVDVLTYDQLGCLSPQAIYFPPGANISALGDKLARALEQQWRAQKQKPARPLSVAARIAEARDLAFALGQRAWLPPKKHLGWTVIHDPKPTFNPSPLHGVIYLRPVTENELPTALDSVAGKISTVGVAGKLSPPIESAFLALGVTRFCPAGRMQFPPLTWHHDGRAPLAELVTWVDDEGTMPLRGTRAGPARATAAATRRRQ